MTTEYLPEKTPWVAQQLEEIEAAGTTGAVSVQGRPVVVFTVRGVKSGKLRRVPLMRVEHEGAYAMVASYGGAPKHPAWYASVRANPEVEVQDGDQHLAGRARLLSGDERTAWWERAVAAFPSYAEYQTKTEREIPVLVVEPTD